MINSPSDMCPGQTMKKVVREAYHAEYLIISLRFLLVVCATQTTIIEPCHQTGFQIANKP